MSASCFIAWNANTSALTSPMVAVATAATVTPKTMLQLVPVSTAKIRIIEWGYTFDGVPANPVKMELIETGSVAATVTAHTSSTVHPYNDQNAVVNDISFGTSATGYTASAEGTITATRPLDYHYENGLWLSRMWPLGREVEIGPSKVLRIRATPSTAAAVNLNCYIIWEE